MIGLGGVEEGIGTRSGIIKRAMAAPIIGVKGSLCCLRKTFPRRHKTPAVENTLKKARYINNVEGVPKKIDKTIASRQVHAVGSHGR